MRKTVAIQLLPYAQVGTLPAQTVYVVPTTYIIDISRACPASEKSNKRDTHGYTAFLHFELCKAARRGRRWSGRPNCQQDAKNGDMKQSLTKSFKNQMSSVLHLVTHLQLNRSAKSQAVCFQNPGVTQKADSTLTSQHDFHGRLMLHVQPRIVRQTSRYRQTNTTNIPDYRGMTPRTSRHMFCILLWNSGSVGLRSYWLNHLPRLILQQQRTVPRLHR